MSHHHRFLAFCFIVIVCVFVSIPTTLQAQAGVQVTTTADLNLRSAPQATAKIITVVPAGTTLAAVGRNQAATWIQVNSASGIGWLSARFVTSSGDLNSLLVTDGQPAPAASAGGAAPAAGVTATVGANGISVRQQPSASSTRLDLLAPGTVVQLTGRSDGTPLWVRISYQGQDAWLAGWLLSIQGDVNTLPVVGAAAQPQAPAPAPAAPTQPAAGVAHLVLDNRMAITVHFVVKGPTHIDVNLGPYSSQSFDVTPGTYELHASTPGYNEAVHTVTLGAGQPFTWHITG